MNARRPWTLLLLASWLAAGCGAGAGASPDAALARTYARDCTGVADCFPVYEGPVSCCATCPNTAIREDAVAAYMSDLAAATVAMCNGQRAPCAREFGCTDGRVACTGGVCRFETPPTDAATE